MRPKRWKLLRKLAQCPGALASSKCEGGSPLTHSYNCVLRACSTTKRVDRCCSILMAVSILECCLSSWGLRVHQLYLNGVRLLIVSEPITEVERGSGDLSADIECHKSLEWYLPTVYMDHILRKCIMNIPLIALQQWFETSSLIKERAIQNTWPPLCSRKDDAELKPAHLQR